jgi:lysophospholipase L1-like esterase
MSKDSRYRDTNKFAADISKAIAESKADINIGVDDSHNSTDITPAQAGKGILYFPDTKAVVYSNSERYILLSNPSNFTLAAIGDSFIQNSSRPASASAVSITNGKLSCTATHQGFNGSLFYMTGANEEAINSVWRMGTGTTASAILNAERVDGTIVADVTGTGTITAVIPNVASNVDTLGQIANLSEGRIKKGLPLGFSGKKASYIKTKVGQIIATRPNYCIEFAGINDIAAGDSASVVFGERLSIWQELVNAGIATIVLSLPPYTASYTAAKHKALLAHNDLCRNYCLKNGILFIDVYSDLVDPTSSTGAHKANLSTDNLHFSSAGRDIIAAKVWSEVQNSVLQLKEKIKLPSSINETSVFDASILQVAPNPLFTVTGGTVTAPASGNCAGSWTLAQSGTPVSVVGSLVARSDGYGNDQVVTYVPDSDADGFTLQSASFNSNAVAGDRLRLVVEVAISGAANLKTLEVALNTQSGGVTAVTKVNGSYSTPQYLTQTNFTRLFISDEITVPASGAVCSISILAVSSGADANGTEVKFGRVGVYNLGQ